MGRNFLDPPLSIFPNLKHLCIDGHRTYQTRTEIDLNVEGESNLETLVIKSNFNCYLDSNLALQRNLKVLKIFQNHSLSINSDGFKGLTQLEELSISFNYHHLSEQEYYESIAKLLTHLPNLKILNLSKAF